MKTIGSRQQLLLHLASRGDSSAFLTLFSGHLRACAIALSKNGKSFSEISQIMLPMCKKLYLSFIGQRAEDADEWFCSNWEGLTADQSFEEFSEQKELGEFESGLQTFLQREQSRYKAKQKKGRNGHFSKGSGRTKRVIFLSAAMPFLLIIMFSAMVFTDTSFEISFSRNGDTKRVVVPGFFFEQLIGDITGHTAKDPVNLDEEEGDSDDPDTLSAISELTDEHAQRDVQSSDL